MSVIKVSGINNKTSANKITTVVYCDECKYLKECRVILKCSHPRGLKNISADSYCSYGKTKEANYEDKTN